MFWKDVTRLRKSEHARDEILNDVNDQILRYGVEVSIRWTGNFEQLLNVKDVN